jgi:hypothetical protein
MKKQLSGSATLLPEIVVKKQGGSPQGAVQPAAAGFAAPVSDFGFTIVGPRGGDVVFKSTGWNISTSPTVVICQARQSDNLDFGFPDQFAIQVIETGTDFIRFRVRRIDDNGAGWGQNLRVDTIVIN